MKTIRISFLKMQSQIVDKSFCFLELLFNSKRKVDRTRCEKSYTSYVKWHICTCRLSNKPDNEFQLDLACRPADIVWKVITKIPMAQPKTKKTKKTKEWRYAAEKVLKRNLHRPILSDTQKTMKKRMAAAIEWRFNLRPEVRKQICIQSVRFAFAYDNVSLFFGALSNLPFVIAGS